MSQDGKTLNVNSLNGQSMGIVTIAVGFAVLIGFYLVPATHWWLFIPAIMLEIGIYGLGIAFFGRLRGNSNTGRWGNDTHYTMFWSSLVTVLGIMWIIYDSLNEVDQSRLAPAFIAAFLFYFGVTVMLMNRNKSNKTKTW